MACAWHCVLEKANEPGRAVGWADYGRFWVVTGWDPGKENTKNSSHGSMLGAAFHLSHGMLVP